MTGEGGQKRKIEDACGESEVIHSKPKTHELLTKININTRLAAQILSEEVSKESKDSSAKNVVCSPLSLEFLLHMVGAGSKGNTLSQILQFIGSKDYPMHSMEDLNLKSSGIMRVASPFCKSDCKEDLNVESSVITRVASPLYHYQEVREKEPELSFANGVWVDERYKLKPSYKELMSSIYDARAESANFGNQADQILGDINSWVADKTKGLIKNILEKLDPAVMLVLVNALYFKGTWSSRFLNGTEDMDFHLLDGSKVSVPFMPNYKPKHFYRAYDGFSVLKLGYQRGEDLQRSFYMLILLPDENDGLQDLLDKCISDPEFLNQDFVRYTDVELFDFIKIPKFKFSYKIEDVRGMMKGLGLTLPFNPGCQDLTEIVELGPGDSLHVSKIIHKAIIEVDESGTKAAAVSFCPTCPGYNPGGSPPPPRIRFVADHPFVFIIKEVITGAVFFVGAVLNPQKGD